MTLTEQQIEKLVASFIKEGAKFKVHPNYADFIVSEEGVNISLHVKGLSRDLTLFCNDIPVLQNNECLSVLWKRLEKAAKELQDTRHSEKESKAKRAFEEFLMNIEE